MAVTGVVFLVFQLGFYMAYGDGNIEKNVLRMYNFDTHKFLFLLDYMFSLSIIPWLPFYIISLIEQLEYMEITQRFLTQKKDKHNVINRNRVRLVRSMGCVVIMGMTIISNDMIKVTNLSGNLFNGIILLIPIVLIYTKKGDMRRSVYWKVHDGFMFVVCFFMFALGSYLAIINF